MRGHVVVKGADTQPLVEVSTSAVDTVQSLRQAAEFALQATTGKAASLKLYVDSDILDESATTSSVGLCVGDVQEVFAAVDVGALLLTCSADFTVRIWDGETGSCLRILRMQQASGMCAAEFGNYGRTVFTSYLDRTLKLWDLDSGRCLWTARGHGGNVRAAAFSPDQMMLLTGAEDRTAKMWDIETGYCSNTFTGHSGSVCAVQFGPDGKVIFTGSLDATAKIWDALTSDCLRTFCGHAGSVLAVCISPDGCLAATGSDDNTFRIWDYLSGSCTIVQTLGSPICSAKFSQDAQFLTLVCGDGMVGLWYSSSGSMKRIFDHTLHTQSCVKSASLSPIGNTLLTGDVAGMAKLWNVQTGACLQSFPGHEGKIMAVSHGLS